MPCLALKRHFRVDLFKETISTKNEKKTAKTRGNRTKYSEKIS